MGYVFAVVYTPVWFLFGRDRCHKASDKTTITAPLQLREKNASSEELTTPWRSRGVGSKPSPSNPHTLDAKDPNPDTGPGAPSKAPHLIPDHSRGGATRRHKGTVSWKPSAFTAAPFCPRPLVLVDSGETHHRWDWRQPVSVAVVYFLSLIFTTAPRAPATAS